MKLIINYDFFNAIRDVREPYGPLTVIRNNNYKYMMSFPLWLTTDVITFNRGSEILSALMLEYSALIFKDMVVNQKRDMDVYADKSIHRLNELASMFEDINVKTNFDLLIKSELYDKRYKLARVNDGKKVLLEEKYILMPSFNYKGHIEDTSILQEHALGSGNYLLSRGMPRKNYQRILKLN